MIDRPAYIGDEALAAGYRLAGALALTPPPGEELAALRQAMNESPLVLISAGIAQRMDADMLREAIAGFSPLVVIVPDLGKGDSLPDDAERLRAEIGLKA